MSFFWNQELRILPFICGVIIIFLPTIIRRFYKIWYSPIYFSVFPLNILNKNLGYYLYEDVYLQSEKLSPEGEKELSKKLKIAGIKSLLAAAIFSPIISSFLNTFYLSRLEINWVLIGALLIKLYSMGLSVREFGNHSVATLKNRLMLFLVYVTYLGVYYFLYMRVFNYASPYIQTRNYQGLFYNILDIFFVEIIIGLVILSAAFGLFIDKIFDKKIRYENMDRLEEMYGENASEQK